MGNTTIKQEILDQAKKDGHLIVAIASIKNKHFGTIQRWFYTNSTHLTNVDVLNTIAKHYGKKVSEITEKTPVSAN